MSKPSDMGKPSLALVAHEIHFRGGQERNFAELAAHLCRDYAVHLVASEVDDVPFEALTVHRIPVVRRPMAARFPSFYAKASRFLQRNAFDLVHTIGGIVRTQNVVTAQFCHAAWLASVRLERGMPGFTPYHFWLTKIAEQVERKALTGPQTRAVLANSSKTRQDLIHYYHTDASKISVIYNGVDIHRFVPISAAQRKERRSQLGYSSTDFLALFVGEYRRKNLADVLRALPLLPDQAKLLAVGRGDISYHQRLARELGVAHRVCFHGPVRNVETFFAAADAFAFPTLYEPFGMVITEAMASGLPVVTTREAGAAELIQDGVNGYLMAQAHDYQHLAACLSHALADPARRQKMAEAARTSVCHVTWEEIAHQTATVYQRVLGGAIQKGSSTQR